MGMTRSEKAKDRREPHFNPGCIEIFVMLVWAVCMGGLAWALIEALWEIAKRISGSVFCAHR
jgi:hypothetical protein